MLARAPVELALEREADRVGGDKLDGRSPELVVGAALASVVPEQPRGAEDTVEGPDDERGPEVVAEAVDGRSASLLAGCDTWATHLTSRAWRYPPMMKMLQE